MGDAERYKDDGDVICWLLWCRPVIYVDTAQLARQISLVASVRSNDTKLPPISTSIQVYDVPRTC